MSIHIQTILYPTDYSDLSLLALKYAKELAGHYHATIHCIHVVDEAQQYWAALGPEATPISPLIGDVTTVAQEQMDAFRSNHLADIEVEPVTKVLLGRPFLEIIRYAKEITCDLLVVATHGRGGLMHALIGSTAERVVRKAPCPVLTVRTGEHEFIMP